MSCWKCECGFKNCDTDECLNPKCIKKAQQAKDLQQRLSGLSTVTTMEKQAITQQFGHSSDSDYKGFIREDY